MKVKSESEFTQSCPTLSDPLDCSLPGSSIHGTLQARALEWGAISGTMCIYFPIVFSFTTASIIPGFNLFFTNLKCNTSEIASW